MHKHKHRMELLWWLSGKEFTCQCKRHRFNPWVRKTPWRRKWQLTPVFLPGKSHGQRSLVCCSPWGCKRLRHDLAIKQQHRMRNNVTHDSCSTHCDGLYQSPLNEAITAPAIRPFRDCLGSRKPLTRGHAPSQDISDSKTDPCGSIEVWPNSK